MLKKIIPIIIIIFLNTSCGFVPKYNGYSGVDFIMKIKNSSGDRDLNNKIESQIRRFETGEKDYQIFEISFDSRFQKDPVSKNSKGDVTRYNLIAIVNFEIKNEDTTRKIVLMEEFKIDKISDTVEENNYIKIIKADFAQSLTERLVLNIRKFR